MVDQVIDNLYTLSRTPKSGHRKITTPALGDSLNHLVHGESRPTQFSSLSDQQIMDFVHFSVRMIDAAPDLRGILQVQDCLHHLISTFLTDATQDVEARTLFLTLLDSWFDSLRQSVPTDITVLDKRPLIKETPLQFFHFVAFNKSLLLDKSFPLYKAYGYKFHLAIRDLKRKHPGKAHYESAVRAARYFFIFMPFDILALPEHQANMPKKYITVFLENAKKRLKSEDIAALTTFYKRIFRQLIRREPVRKRRKTGKKRKRSVSDSKSDIEHIVDVEIEPETEEDIEFLSNDFLHGSPGEFVIARKPHLSRSWMDTNTVQSHHFWWDIDCLKLDELHALYAVCARYWGKSDQFDRIIVYILMALHFGPREDVLLGLSCDADHIPRIQKINEHLYYVVDGPIKRLSNEPCPNCREASDIVYLPLPSKLARLIEPKLRISGKFFEYKATADGGSKQLELHHVVQFIEKCINGTTGFRLTLSRLRSSCPVLYSGRFGLDPIFSCYASGAVIHGLYGSQLHYIYCDSARLSAGYYTAYKRLDSRITTFPHAPQYNEDLRTTKPQSYDLFFHEDKSHPPSEPPIPGYGSHKVPILSVVHEAVESIKSSILSSTTLIQRHNRYTCYAYLCLEFSGGMRPRNEPDDDTISLVKNCDCIVLRDKQGPQFSEERLISLPPTASRIIARLDDNAHKLGSQLAVSINSLLMNLSVDELFFFLDEEGNKQPFTLDGFRNCLRKSGQEYEFPNNSPRHYLKTYLHENNVSIEISDAWCGHSHTGREALNEASAAVLSETYGRCREIVERMLQELGFQDIPYPGGHL